MTGKISFVASLIEVDGGKIKTTITFGNNTKGRICGEGIIDNSSLYINDVLILKV